MTEKATLIAMMMPKDMNPQGIIFGGVILSYIDQAGAIYSQNRADICDKPVKFVTVAMDKVLFKEPVYVGDVLSLFVEELKTGSSSITVKVEVVASRSTDYRNVKVTEANLTYVAVDEDRKPVKDLFK